MFNLKYLSNNSKTSKFYRILSIFFYIGSVFFLFYISKEHFLCGEDVDQGFFTQNSLLQLYQESDHGCFIASTLMKFFCSFIPSLLNIHPNDCPIRLFIEAAVIAFIPYFLSLFISAFSNNSCLKTLYYISTSLIFFSYFSIYGFLIDDYYYVYSRFSRYILMALFYLIFWFNFSKYFIEDCETNTKSKITLLVAAFIIGLSSEPLNISTFCSLSIFTIYYLLQKAIHQKEVPKLFIHVCIAFLTGFVLFYLNPCFWSIASSSREISSIASILQNTILYFSEFTKKWFKIVFFQDFRWVFTFGIILLSVFIGGFAPKNNKKVKILIYSWSLVIGAAIFNYTLIASGKSFYDLKSFWLVSLHLRFDSLIMFMTSFFTLLGYSLNTFKRKSANIILVFYILIISMILYLNPVPSFHSCIDLKKRMTIDREKMYMCEKMYVFYSLKGKTALLPKSIQENNVFSFSFTSLQPQDFTSKTLSDEYMPAFGNYYNSLYKGNKLVPVKLIDDKMAMSQFESEGGKFFPGEIRKANFTALFDKKFILNK